MSDLSNDIPKELQDLLKKRREEKESLKKLKEDDEAFKKYLYEGLQPAYKIIANSPYNIPGYSAICEGIIREDLRKKGIDISESEILLWG